MDNTRVYHFSLTPDDFIYNRNDCTNYCRLEIPGLEVYDKVDIKVYESLYSFGTFIKSGCLYLAARMKPYKVIRLRVVVTKVY